VLLVPKEVLVENSVMVAPAARVSDVSSVAAPVTSNAPVTFVFASNSMVPAPPGFKCSLALVGVLISLSLINMLSMVAVPVMVGVSKLGAVRVSTVLPSPNNSSKLSFIFRNAVLKGSPVPSFALDPTLIVCFAILIIYLEFYKPDVIY
jgi:hypothetical protein